MEHAGSSNVLGHKSGLTENLATKEAIAGGSSGGISALVAAALS